MSVTAAGSIMAAYPGANNMVGKVEQVNTNAAQETVGGGAVTAMGEYPHDENGSEGAFAGPVNQAEQKTGAPTQMRGPDESVPDLAPPQIAVGNR
jgi:hypothetical protein